ISCYCFFIMQGINAEPLTVGFDFKERLEEGRHRHIKEWTNANLSPNLAVKRINTIGKKCVGF
uniref:hypothetical protein n=1 Tax=Prevotella sp. TaxID=59823 RepID=UPI004029E57E